jgi:hypothetical protein
MVGGRPGRVRNPLPNGWSYRGPPTREEAVASPWDQGVLTGGYPLGAIRAQGWKSLGQPPPGGHKAPAFLTISLNLIHHVIIFTLRTRKTIHTLHTIFGPHYEVNDNLKKEKLLPRRISELINEQFSFTQSSYLLKLLSLLVNAASPGHYVPTRVVVQVCAIFKSPFFQLQSGPCASSATPSTILVYVLSYHRWPSRPNSFRV